MIAKLPLNLQDTFSIIFYFWLHWVFIAGYELSLDVVSRGYSSNAVASLVVSKGSVVGAQGLISHWHVGSSWARDQTCVPRIGRWIFNHWTTKEVQEISFFSVRRQGKQIGSIQPQESKSTTTPGKVLSIPGAICFRWL